jgi:hypothetical protein
MRELDGETRLGRAKSTLKRIALAIIRATRKRLLFGRMHAEI